MRYFIMLVVVTAVFLCTEGVNAQQGHKNVIREAIKDNPLDMWKGEPKRKYTKLGDVYHDNSQLTVGEGYTPLLKAVIGVMKNAIELNADAIIHMECGATRFPGDNGDYFDKEPMMAAWVRPLYCKGMAVKYSD